MITEKNKKEFDAFFERKSNNLTKKGNISYKAITSFLKEINIEVDSIHVSCEHNFYFSIGNETEFFELEFYESGGYKFSLHKRNALRHFLTYRAESLDDEISKFLLSKMKEYKK